MNPLVECVPNFSEGRRTDVISQIVDAIRAVRGVIVLDASSNVDHNRSVVTFVGSPAMVEEAAFVAIARAADLIDMEQHCGAHPRIGATDVVPFVPVRGTSMDECSALARRLGERVGRELDIPVYLYEAAASRPDRRNLADIRRGEYEGLRAAIETGADRAPDFGPSRMGKAGATIIGARQFLVAYNVYLSTSDVEVAKKIARAIRHSNGGFRFVKSLGLLVDGLAQVSVNFTDFTQTPLHRVQETIRREAERYGVGIKFSEVIGVVPQAALIDSAAWYLQLDCLEGQQILENRLADLPPPALPDAFAELVAEPTPSPGGGAVAALAGALAAALTEMVAGLADKKGEESEAARGLTARAQTLRRQLMRAIDEDRAAVDAMMRASHLPGRTGEEVTARDAAVQAALVRATEVCCAVAGQSFAVLQMAEDTQRLSYAPAIGDVAAAAFMAQAAIEICFLNARIDSAEIRNRQEVEACLTQLKDIATRAPAITERLKSAVEKVDHLPPV